MQNFLGILHQVNIKRHLFTLFRTGKIIYHERHTVKSKRKDNIKSSQSTLLALLGSILLSTQVMAADPVSQGEAAKGGTVANPAAQGSISKEVVSADPNAQFNTPKKPKRSPIYAKVGNMSVTWLDYESEYASQASKKFYHGKPSEAMIAEFQREIGDTLVTNAMLVQEAKRRKLKPDSEEVNQKLAQFEQRFAQDPNWPKARARVLPIITVRLQNESLRSQLEERVRNVPPPSEKQLRKYYEAHPEKFTSPPQTRVSIILLRVDPSAPDADWQKAIEEGQNLVKRARNGEDFATLARDYSGDVTAEDGGDMGYLHEGMLPGLPAQTVSKLQPGEISDPVTLMEGVAIFRLTERKLAEINSFKSVRERARELWLAEKSENAWNSLIAKLKKSTPVQIDESRFLPLPAVNKTPAESSGANKP
jgi:parvulin-like peptidyl-prolyl isomerase